MNCTITIFRYPNHPFYPEGIGTIVWDFVAVAAASTSYTWTGGTNAWATGSNWTPTGPPTSSDAATIPWGTPFAPTIVNSVSVASLTVNSGAALQNTNTLTVTGALNNSGTIATSGNTVNAQGNITNNGSITGSFNANGSSAQTINGTGSFAKLTLNNTAGATINSGATKITGTLALTAGTLATAGFLTIAPGAAITGTYSNLTGTVTLQQSIIGQRGYRMFANPFSTATDIAITATNNTIAITTTPYSGSNLTDARTFSNSTNLWGNVTGTTLAANTPYALFIRGLNSEVTGGSYTGGPSAFT